MKKPQHHSTPDEDLYRIIRLIRPLFRALLKAVERQLASTDISVTMRAVLEQLDEQGPMTVPRMANSMGIKRQYTQRTMNSALESELVRAIRNPHHKRSPLFEITPLGSKSVRKIREAEQQLLRPIARSLSRTEMNSCAKVLTKLTDVLQRATDMEDEDAWRRNETS